MKVSIEEKKIEAIERMKLLEIYPETIQQFDKEGYVSISEPPFGAFFWAEDESLELIKSFEERTDSLVYLVIRSYTEFGKLDNYLFVSDYKDEEWEMDRKDLSEGMVFSYVHNYDIPEFSEFGTIGFKPTLAAGLIRVW